MRLKIPVEIKSETVSARLPVLVRGTSLTRRYLYLRFADEGLIYDNDVLLWDSDQSEWIEPPTTSLNHTRYTHSGSGRAKVGELQFPEPGKVVVIQFHRTTAIHLALGVRETCKTTGKTVWARAFGPMIWNEERSCWENNGGSMRLGDEQVYAWCPVPPIVAEYDRFVAEVGWL
jgi:hypothetical protein